MPKRVLVPEGSFLMGSRGVRDDEEPEHRVFLSGFEMAATPVTRMEYAIYLQSTGVEPPPWWEDPVFSRPRQPVVGVNWHEAIVYCRWLSEETGLELRLPTEAQREKAARGGRTQRQFPWGDDPAAGGHARLAGPLEGPDDVALTPPNDFGLFNLADNVHEWCLDGYHPGFYEVSPDENPCAPPTSIRRSARGGSWRHQCVVTRCAARSSLPPELHYSDFGFRCVREI
ncbi:MAG TPA: SUMF1/EgtB/PvdO family nonheme iron enzyme [Vicinamibacteria bacterium]